MKLMAAWVQEKKKKNELDYRSREIIQTEVQRRRKERMSADTGTM